MSEPVPGWAAVDEEERLDPARHPIGEVLREVVAIYRRDFAPILVLAAIFEGSISLLTLPYLAFSVRLGLRALDVMSRIFAEPVGSARFSEMATIFDALRQPGVAAYGGIVSVAPVASIVLLTAAVAALFGSAGERRTPEAATGTVVRRWPVLLLPLAALGIAAATLSTWSSAATADMFALPLSASNPPDIGPSIALSLLAPIVVVGAAYLAVRWAVAVPALVVEGIGLRSALARSSALTARRRLYVALCLLAVGAIWAIVGWIFVIPALLLAAGIMALGGGPLLAAPLALYVIGRILLAPLLPILCTILYRDLRSAGPRTPARPADDQVAPPGWGSPS